MSLRKFITVGLLSVTLFTFSKVSFAANEAVKPEVSFKAAFPQVEFESITPSEIPGLYEVVFGANVLYYYPAKELVIVGNIVGKDMKSHTAERRAALLAELSAKAAKIVKTLPLDKAVKIGEGKHVVIEFTDPDCPYCRKAAEYFTKRTDVTQYIFFAPIAHPGAMPKIQYILGADNKAQAFDAMMLGQEIPAGAKPASDAVKSLAQEHLTLARKVGIQGTPTFFVNGQQVTGADTQKLDELLK